MLRRSTWTSGPFLIKPRAFVASVHFMRIAAAVLVILDHVGVSEWLGYAGVVLFFLISGFVMYHTARSENVLEFVRRRIIRIVPLYWIVTTFLFMITIVFDHAVHDDTVSYLYLYVYSIFFLPREWNGNAFPVLQQGWTLNLEMSFYAIFAIGLLIRRPLLLCATTLSVLVFLGETIGRENYIFRFYTDPTVVYFPAGMLIAAAFERVSFERMKPLLPLGATMLLYMPILDIERFAGFAGNIPNLIGAVFVMAGFLAFEPFFLALKNRSFLLLGDATYAIYLTHIIVIVFVSRLVSLSPATSWPFAPYLVVQVALSLAAGVVTHLLIERPMLRRLRGRRAERSPRRLHAYADDAGKDA